MVSFTPRVKEVLREHGCQMERTGNGDHEIWYSPITQRRFPVDGKILSRHTANAVLTQPESRSSFKLRFGLNLAGGKHKRYFEPLR